MTTKINKRTKKEQEVCAYDLIKDKKLSLEEAAFRNSEDDWTANEKMQLRKEVVGFYDKSIVVDKYLKTFDGLGIKSIDESEDDADKNHVWGLVTGAQEKLTKKGNPYVIIACSGLSEKSYSFRMWGTKLEEINHIWNPGNVVVFSLTYDSEWENFTLNKRKKTIVVTK
jgi:DNA polymerase III alpha subunit